MSSQSPRPSPCRPARRIGTCCCAPGRSRRAPSSSPRRRSASMRTGGAPTAIRWWSIRGARCCSTWAARRPGWASPRSIPRGSPKCARNCRALPTAGRSRRFQTRMIVFDLSAPHGHRFEGWFGSSDDYAGAARARPGRLPAVRLGRGRQGADGAGGVRARATGSPKRSGRSPAARCRPKRRRCCQAGRDARPKRSKSSSWVGDASPTRTRAIHYGEREARGDPRPGERRGGARAARGGHPDRPAAVSGRRRRTN